MLTLNSGHIVIKEHGKKQYLTSTNLNGAIGQPLGHYHAQRKTEMLICLIVFWLSTLNNYEFIKLCQIKGD